MAQTSQHGQRKQRREPARIGPEPLQRGTQCILETRWKRARLDMLRQPKRSVLATGKPPIHQRLRQQHAFPRSPTRQLAERSADRLQVRHIAKHAGQQLLNLGG